MTQHLQKTLAINGLTESSYLALVTGLASYAKWILDVGGIYSIMLLPVFELVKAKAYWDKSSQSDSDAPLKIMLNRTFNGLKVAGSGAGASFAMAGMATLGFGILILIGYMNVLRNVGKAARSTWDGDAVKVSKNLEKALVGALIAGGFTLMTFVLPWAWMGTMMVFVGTGHGILSLPSVIAKTFAGAENTHVGKGMFLSKSAESAAKNPTDSPSNKVS